MNILIVDPIISTHYLIERLRSYNFKIIILDTLHKKIDVDFFKLSNLGKEIIHVLSDSCAETDIRKLKKYNINHVLYGSEFSVSYTDMVADKLGINFNSTLSSKLRYDKYYMIEKMNILNQETIINKKNSDIFFKKNRLQNAILKPRFNSAGCDHVYSVSSYDDICRKISTITKNIIGEKYEYVLQEKIDIKKEFFIDVASYQGQHGISCIGFYNKDDEHISYKEVKLLDKYDQNYHKLCSYAIDVLSKLEVKFGLSHIEVALDNNDELKLIELNPRISGVKGFINKLSMHNFSHDQISLYIEMISNNRENQMSIKFIENKDEIKWVKDNIEKEDYYVNQKQEDDESTEYNVFGCLGFYII